MVAQFLCMMTVYTNMSTEHLKNKELVNRHYLGQHVSDNDKEIKGQTGSPGVVGEA